LELVYLWVDKYKNIKKQGFNFSPRFECKYENDELIIIEKKEDKYINNFFGDNINITAIVGKNGSGKSALLFQNIYIPKDIKILFNNNVLHIVYLDSDNNNADTLNINNHTRYTVKAKEVGDLDYTIYLNWDFVKPSYMNVYTYMFGKDNPNILLPLFRGVDNKILLEGIDINLLDLDYFNSEIIRKIIQFNNDFSFQTFSYRPYNIRFDISKNKIEKLNHHPIGKKILQLKTYQEKGMTFDDFLKFYYKDNEDYILHLLSERVLFLEITDKKHRNLFDLSHGERSIFIGNLILFDKVKEKNTNLIIYLDEPDLTLHPEWQKKYINELIKTFSSWNKKIHFIITSHSPFIVSDLPKENIIFLDKGKQVKGTEKKQTFGANIHTLLSDSFFMDNGLMGEFAKNKINKIIRFLNGKNRFIDFPIEYIEKVINSIGEPFLKQKLSKMYFDKFDTKKQDRIKELKAELKRLENG